MYLLPSGARSTTKWRELGAYKMRRGLDLRLGAGAAAGGTGSGVHSGVQSLVRGTVHATGANRLVVSRPFFRRRGMNLGDDPTYIDPGDTLTPPVFTSPTTLLLVPQSAGDPSYRAYPSQIVSPPPTGSPNVQSITNMLPSASPLDYISPQAAIAAGLDAQSVYATWTKGLAKYPTQTAALSAGIPAGVVTQLWTQSRQAAGAAASAPSFSPVLIAGGVGLLAFVLLSGGGKKGRG